jgi:hypothetical protein
VWRRQAAQVVAAEVFDHGAQVAQLAFGVNEAGLFFAGVSVADEFHEVAFLSMVMSCYGETGDF